jgi:hypothetical protein
MYVNKYRERERERERKRKSSIQADEFENQQTYSELD